MDNNQRLKQGGEDLIEQARQGNQDAMRRLYDETKSYAWFIAKRYLQSDADVEDVLQEVFLAVFTKLGSFDGGNFKAWVHRIVTNRCLNFIRDQKLIFASQEEVEDLACGNEETIPSEWLERAERRRDVLKIIDALPPGQRMAVTMFYLEGLPVAEIAVVMGIAQGAVRNHLYHGRQAIKAYVLEEEEKGNKLYSLVPLPLLARLYELEAEGAVLPEAVSETVWSGVVRNLGDMAAGAARQGGKFSTLSAGLKALIITGIVLLAAAAVGTPIILTAVGTPNPYLPNMETPAQETQNTPPFSDEDESVVSTGDVTTIPVTTAPATEAPATTAPSTPSPAETGTPSPEIPSPVAETETPPPPTAAPVAAKTFLAQVKMDPNEDTPDGLPIFVDDYLFISGDDAANIAKYGIDTSDGLDYYLHNETKTWVRYIVRDNAALSILELDDISNKIGVGIQQFRFHLLGGVIWAEVSVSSSDEIVKIEQVYYP